MGIKDSVDALVQKAAGSATFAKVAKPVMPALDKVVLRLTGGKYLLSNAFVPAIVLHTTGAKSGLPRESPLASIPDGRDLYVVGSNWGGEKHPAWTANLIAHPDARVTFKGEDFAVRAELLSPEEKATVWPKLLEVWPTYDRYVERSGRDLRVFRLVRV